MNRLPVVVVSILLACASAAALAQAPARVRGTITAIDGDTLSVKSREGKIVALELHLFPAGRPVPAEGHRPWDLEPGSTMTNGIVTAMAEGKLTATRVQITKDGVRPPQ